MLLNSTRGIPSSQQEEDSSLLRSKIEEESSSLGRKIEELNRNTVLLIVEAGKLIQGSKELSDQLKTLQNASTKPKVAITTAG